MEDWGDERGQQGSPENPCSKDPPRRAGGFGAATEAQV